MVCCGSSVFLKNKYGIGYSITFTKSSPDQDSRAIVDTIRKYVPNCEILTDVATDLAVQVSMEHVSKFPALFNEIDEKKSVLRYVEYGISITTLEEVFLNVGASIENQRKERRGESPEKNIVTEQEMKEVSTPVKYGK